MTTLETTHTSLGAAFTPAFDLRSEGRGGLKDRAPRDILRAGFQPPFALYDDDARNDPHVSRRRVHSRLRPPIGGARRVEGSCSQGYPARRIPATLCALR